MTGAFKGGPTNSIIFIQFLAKETLGRTLTYCKKAHNACYLTITNEPFYLVRSCQRIKKGEPISCHYGPSCGLLLYSIYQRKYVC